MAYAIILLALLGLRTSIIVSILCSVHCISERELLVSFEKGGNWVCTSFTVEIEAKTVIQTISFDLIIKLPLFFTIWKCRVGVD